MHKMFTILAALYIHLYSFKGLFQGYITGLSGIVGKFAFFPNRHAHFETLTGHINFISSK